jgi:hypothetical protein
MFSIDFGLLKQNPMPVLLDGAGAVAILVIFCCMDVTIHHSILNNQPGDLFVKR